MSLIISLNIGVLAVLVFNMYKQDFTQKCPDYFHFSKIKLQQYDGDISILETRPKMRELWEL